MEVLVSQLKNSLDTSFESRIFSPAIPKVCRQITWPVYRINSGFLLFSPCTQERRKMVRIFSLSNNEIWIINLCRIPEISSTSIMVKLILTDSGGVQDESCILSVPCIGLRENTVRPETFDAGSNILADTNPENITPW